jgi:hypothetical protein
MYLSGIGLPVELLPVGDCATCSVPFSLCLVIRRVKEYERAVVLGREQTNFLLALLLFSTWQSACIKYHIKFLGKVLS